MTKELICINCPLGCRLTAILENQAVISVSGNHCARGKKYAMQEAIRPMRVLTGIMRAKGAEKPFSVRSDQAIPKDLLLLCAAELRRIHPDAPVRAGDIVIPHILGTESNILATENFDNPL